MKKKVETLLGDAKVRNNAGFKPLYENYQSAKTAREAAKKEKSGAKNAYRNALATNKKGSEGLLEAHAAYVQAKSMHAYHGAGYQLAKFRLYRWVEAYLKNAPKAKSATRAKPAKTGPSKTSRPKTARSVVKPGKPETEAAS